MHKNQEQTGVVLLNMGGPHSIDQVGPFLLNLFSDREIIHLGPFPFLQRFIARRIVAKRLAKSTEAYRQIGGSSPLVRISTEQGKALEEQLRQQGPYTVACAMRYWHPFATETLARFATAGTRRLIALPLYPHYSRATNGSSLTDLRRAAAQVSPDFIISEVQSWPDHPDYIAALASSVDEGLSRFPEPDRVTVVYSAHSLPVSFIEQGDPYLDQIKQTIAAVEQLTGISGRLCFQSRSGPVRWLEPSTPDMMRTLAEGGMKNLLIVPISFVSDHVETLYEIDIEYRKLALSMGLRMERSPSLNTHPRLIAALADLVLSCPS